MILMALDHVRDYFFSFKVDPTDMATTMGALISRDQFDKVLRYIDIAHTDGAQLLALLDLAEVAEGQLVLGLDPGARVGGVELLEPAVRIGDGRSVERVDNVTAARRGIGEGLSGEGHGPGEKEENAYDEARQDRGARLESVEVHVAGSGWSVEGRS